MAQIRLKHGRARSVKRACAAKSSRYDDFLHSRKAAWQNLFAHAWDFGLSSRQKHGLQQERRRTRLKLIQVLLKVVATSERQEFMPSKEHDNMCCKSYIPNLFMTSFLRPLYGHSLESRSLELPHDIVHQIRTKRRARAIDSRIAELVR